MKKSLFFILFISVVLNASAASSRNNDVEGLFVFLGIVLIAFCILQIILFFKLWGMTNDVKELKLSLLDKDIPEFNSYSLIYLRKNLIMGNKEVVKRFLLKNFMNEIENKFDDIIKAQKAKTDKSNIDISDLEEKSLDYSIEVYVDNLKKQYSKIGEKIPAYIENMKSYRDYFDIFVTEDFLIEDE